MKTIVLDWDGTLADTLPAHYGACSHVFTEAGLPPPSMFEWRKLRPPFETFYRDRGVKTPSDRIWYLYNSFFNARVLRSALFPDAMSFLALVRRFARIVIVSGAEEDRIRRHCLLTGVDSLVRDVFAGVEHKWEIFRCFKGSGNWSVSDLAHDTAEAKRAGLRTVGLTRGVSPWIDHKQAGADVIASNLMRVLPFIKNGRL